LGGGGTAALRPVEARRPFGGGGTAAGGGVAAVWRWRCGGRLAAEARRPFGGGVAEARRQVEAWRPVESRRPFGGGGTAAGGGVAAVWRWRCGGRFAEEARRPQGPRWSRPNGVCARGGGPGSLVAKVPKRWWRWHKTCLCQLVPACATLVPACATLCHACATHFPRPQFGTRHACATWESGG
jgi:hypothetical protein